MERGLQSASNKQESGVRSQESEIRDQKINIHQSSIVNQSAILPFLSGISDSVVKKPLLTIPAPSRRDGGSPC